ncbi:hypothetical protein ACHAXT_009602 [Thalassiosira profunda]
MNPALLPTFVVFILTVAAITATVVVFSSSIHHVKLEYEGDIAQVNDNLRAIQSQQQSYATQVQTLAKLVSESLNATDEYIHNITDTVSETKDVIAQDVATVQDIQDNQNSLMAVQFAGMFTILVILVSGYHLSQHLRHMHEPVVQRKIMAVLWMTPIYSLSSWLSLVFPNAEPYLAVIREFYESYCVYMFMAFLISVLGRGDRHAVVTLLEQRADQLPRVDKCRCGPKFWKRCWRDTKNKCGKRRSVPNDLSLSPNAIGGGADPRIANDDPMSPGGSIVDENGHYVSPSRLKAEAVLDQCQLYAMQFVLLRPITAIGWLVSNQLVQPDKFLDPTAPQMYITIMTNASIFFAFRGLVRFYHATRSNLAWCNPWPKFLCIKGVVFMTFWQKMMLGLIVNIGYGDKFDTQEDANDFIMQAQNFLICLEMLFSAVAHCFVFSPDEWSPGYREREERRKKETESRSFGDAVALGDFINDVKVVMASKKRRKRRKKLSQGLGSPSSMEEEEDEADTLDLSLAPSEEDLLPDGSRRGSTVSDPSGPDANGQDSEYSMVELSTPSPRRRLDTGGSVDSDTDHGGVGGSLARIEQFLNEHTPKQGDDEKEIV